MVVGLLSMVLAIPEAASLKDKRRVVRRVLDRARARFHVAAAETGALDVHRKAMLSFAVVSNDVRHARSMLDTVASFVASTAAEATIVSQRSKVERRSDLVPGSATELDEMLGGAGAPAAWDDDDESSDDDETMR